MKNKDELKIAEDYIEQVNKLIKKHKELTTKKSQYDDEEVVNQLYKMICQCHHLDEGKPSEDNLIETIDRFLKEDQIADGLKQCEDMLNHYEQERISNPAAWSLISDEFKKAKDHYDTMKINDYLRIYQKYRFGKLTGKALSDLLDQTPLAIFFDCAYRNSSDNTFLCLEDDFLIVCKKGYFLIKIGEAGHKTILIQKNGTMFYDNKPVEDNLTMQCIRDKEKLVKLLNIHSPSKENIICSMLYLKNDTGIENHFNKIDVYNNISMLANDIISKPDIFPQENAIYIARLLASGMYQKPRFEFATAKYHCYEMAAEFISKNKLLIEKLTVERNDVNN